MPKLVCKSELLYSDRKGHQALVLSLLPATLAVDSNSAHMIPYLGYKRIIKLQRRVIVHGIGSFHHGCLDSVCSGRFNILALISITLQDFLLNLPLEFEVLFNDSVMLVSKKLSQLLCLSLDKVHCLLEDYWLDVSYQRIVRHLQ